MCFVSLLFFIYLLGGSLSDTETIKRNVIVNGKQRPMCYEPRVCIVHSRSSALSVSKAKLIDDMMSSSSSSRRCSAWKWARMKHKSAVCLRVRVYECECEWVVLRMRWNI
uniref:Putative secreted protein n=1 Tax=Anopheles marajoara TaxID=58244 RepID=A0A2M4C8Z4_9DIPT